MRAAGALVQLDSEYSICSAMLQKGEEKYAMFSGPSCSGAGWGAMQGGAFRARASKGLDLFPVTWCDNTRFWTQHIVQGEACPDWGGLAWEHGGTFWAARGQAFCVGSREDAPAALRFSRVRTGADCGGGGFRHEFAFGHPTAPPAPPSMVLCVAEGRVRAGAACRGQRVFSARPAAAALAGDRRLCAEAGGLREGGCVGDV